MNETDAKTSNAFTSLMSSYVDNHYAVHEKHMSAIDDAVSEAKRLTDRIQDLEGQVADLKVSPDVQIISPWQSSDVVVLKYDMDPGPEIRERNWICLTIAMKAAGLESRVVSVVGDVDVSVWHK